LDELGSQRPSSIGATTILTRGVCFEERLANERFVYTVDGGLVHCGEQRAQVIGEQGRGKGFLGFSWGERFIQCVGEGKFLRQVGEAGFFFLIRHEAQHVHLVNYSSRNLTPLPHEFDTMPINKVRFQPGMAMSEFVERYGSEDQCARALEQIRWPAGYRCPKYGES